MQTTSNRLIHAASPYLLQHAHNPVDWFEWGDEALQKAKTEDKPILVSIGYSSCHWCHVMERESFENNDIAQLMNEYFVCIKVDREERPDIDQIYMDAVQALGVHGGWPLNVFVTPEQKPFFGGTYFSPQAWSQILVNINRAFQGNRKQIEDTAQELSLHLLRSEVAQFKQPGAAADVKGVLDSIFKKLQTKFDSTWGGMDRAPKFIMPSVWQLLLRYYHLTKNEGALNHIVFTLKKIEMGGIYDALGGGFARYSVDGQWFAPHFEKMLYDNAQLVSLYSEAYQVTRDESFKRVVYETVEWLRREMTDVHGGFYSALDADSEGEEGKYYVWKQSELDQLLGQDAALFSSYYSTTREGNWEHGNNILIRYNPDAEFLKKHQRSSEDWNKIWQKSKQVLLSHRERRIKPGLDDKIITSWNAMMISGLIDAYQAFSDESFLALAKQNIEFLEKELIHNKVFRSYRGKRSPAEGFLDDYAYVIQAYLKLYQSTFEEQYLDRALSWTNYTVTHFYDSAEESFYYTSSQSQKLIARKKEMFDNVIPSSNAVMAQNLFRIGSLLQNEEWIAIASKMTDSFGKLVQEEPNYMSYWAMAYLEIKKGLTEVVLLGPAFRDLSKNLQLNFSPYALFMGAFESSSLPLAQDKNAIGGKTALYVCFNRTCANPVTDIESALEIIRENDEL